MGGLRLTDDTWLLVLTGAGVSAESGIPTFRDGNGLWENHRVEEVASPEGFADDPGLVWRFYSLRRRAALQCQPNAGHVALARVERTLGQRFLLVTQNVDGLHVRAGSRRLVELHGNLFLTRCSNCQRRPFQDEREYETGLPYCDECARGGTRALLRPHIVWFGEGLDPAHLEVVSDFLDEGRRGRLVFLAVGTSGLVYPAAGMVDLAASAGAETWLVNAEPPANRSRFRHYVEGPSGKVLPGLFSGGEA